MSGRRAVLRVAGLLLLAMRAGAATQVSNLSESNSVNFTSQGTFAHASAFTTGASAMQLASITVATHSNSTGTTELRLRADSAGSPGAIIVSLGSQTNPGGSAALTYSAGGFPVLAANTTYWVTLGETGSGDLSWQGTTSTAQTSPSSWTIGDQMKRSSNGGASWVDVNFGPANESGLFSVDANAAAPPPLAGDAFVTDSGTGSLRTLFRVDLANGNRTVVSGCIDATCTSQQGSGLEFGQPYGIGRLANGSLLVADIGIPTLFSVDPATGNRTVVSGCANVSCSSVVGTGISFVLPVDVSVSGSSILVADIGRKAVISVDPANGNRTSISGCANDGCSSTVGSGTAFVFPNSVARTTSGVLVVVEGPGSLSIPGPRRVVAVDPLTGNRTTLSGCFDSGCSIIIGTGPNFDSPAPATIEASGTIVLADSGLQAILRIDPSSGNRIVVSGGAVGTGIAFSYPVWVEMASNGDLFLTDNGVPALFHVDPVAGNRSVVSSNALGTGLAFDTPIGLLLPEPGPIAAVAASLAMLALLERRRARRR